MLSEKSTCNTSLRHSLRRPLNRLLTDCSSTREAAFSSSRFSVFERHFDNSAQTENSATVTPAKNLEHCRPPPEDEITTAAVLHAQILEKVKKSSSCTAKVLEKTAYKGNNDWIFSNVRFVPSQFFTLALICCFICCFFFYSY